MIVAKKHLFNQGHGSIVASRRRRVSELGRWVTVRVTVRPRAKLSGPGTPISESESVKRSFKFELASRDKLCLPSHGTSPSTVLELVKSIKDDRLPARETRTSRAACQPPQCRLSAASRPAARREP